MLLEPENPMAAQLASAAVNTMRRRLGLVSISHCTCSRQADAGEHPAGDVIAPADAGVVATLSTPIKIMTAAQKRA